MKNKEQKLALVQKPASYIIKMAQNAVMDHFRSRHKHPIESSELLTAYSEPSNTEVYNLSLLPFIDRLPAKYREALILCDLQGVSQKELAEKLNISYTGARSRVQRGRQLLKEAILNCCDYRFDRFGNIIGCCE